MNLEQIFVRILPNRLLSLCGYVEEMNKPRVAPPQSSEEKPQESEQERNRRMMAAINGWKESVELDESSRTLRSPRFPSGIPAVADIESIFKTQTRLLHVAHSISGLGDDEYAEIVIATLTRFAEWVELLPASRGHHHREAGGLFRHSLQTAILASQNSEAIIFPRTGTIGQIQHNKARWRIAAFMGGLFHDIGKVAGAFEVYADNECSTKRWVPHVQSLSAWCRENRVKNYYLKWRENDDPRRLNHEQYNAALLSIIAPPALVAWLSDSAPNDIYGELALALENTKGKSILAKLIHQSDAESCAIYERENSGLEAAVFDEGAGYPERRCFDALRLLIAGNELKVNTPDGMAWFVNGCLFFEWTDQLYGLIRRKLSEEGAQGIPSQKEDMLTMLVSAEKVVVHDLPHEDGGTFRTALWSVAVQIDGREKVIDKCIFVANRGAILPPDTQDIPGYPQQAAQKRSAPEESRDEQAAQPDQPAPKGGEGEQAQSNPVPARTGNAADPANLDRMPKVQREQYTREAVRGALTTPGLGRKDVEPVSEGIAWEDFPQLLRLSALRGITKDNRGGFQLTDEQFDAIEAVKRVLPPEMPTVSLDGSVAELIDRRGWEPYWPAMAGLKTLREKAPGAADLSLRVREMVPLWISMAATLLLAVQNGATGVPLVNVDHKRESLSITNWRKFAEEHGVSGEASKRILARLRSFRESVRDPAVMFKDEFSYLVLVLFSTSGTESSLGFRTALFERLTAVFDGRPDPRLPLKDIPAPAAQVRISVNDPLPQQPTGDRTSNEQMEQGAQDDAQERAEELPEVVEPGADRTEITIVDEFAALMDTAPATIGGKKVMVGRTAAGGREVLVPLSAVEGFLAERNLTRTEKESARRLLNDEYQLKQRGISRVQREGMKLRKIAGA